jgi:hypothetical protein
VFRHYRAGQAVQLDVLEVLLDVDGAGALADYQRRDEERLERVQAELGGA